jgi:hypothetical protein
VQLFPVTESSQVSALTEPLRLNREDIEHPSAFLVNLQEFHPFPHLPIEKKQIPNSRRIWSCWGCIWLGGGLLPSASDVAGHASHGHWKKWLN